MQKCLLSHEKVHTSAISTVTHYNGIITFISGRISSCVWMRNETPQAVMLRILKLS